MSPSNISAELFLAALIAYRTGCFAGRLARGLAFAATAGQCRFGQRCFIYRLNMFSHVFVPPGSFYKYILSLFETPGKSNYGAGTSTSRTGRLDEPGGDSVTHKDSPAANSVNSSNSAKVPSPK